MPVNPRSRMKCGKIMGAVTVVGGVFLKIRRSRVPSK
jgi:hypothetical protein